MITRRISNSEIRTFLECRRRWWLAWHRGLRPSRPSVMGALRLGERIHDALATYYVPGLGPDPRERLEVLLEEDRTFLKANTDATPEIWKQFESEADLQRIMLEGYVAWLTETGADQDLEIIESERYVEAPFFRRGDFQVVIIGRLDVLGEDRWSKQLVFLDHKTTASILASVKNLQLNPQMKMYRLILQLSERRDVFAAVYSMLRKVKRTVKANPPFFQRETIPHNRHELLAFQGQLMGIINDILTVEHHLKDVYTHPAEVHNRNVYPSPGGHCNFCPFQRECVMMDDGSRAEDSLASRFIVGEPLSYYGKDDLARVQPGSRPLDPTPRRIEAG